jgi:16S rRNA processing protein RimM
LLKYIQFGCVISEEETPDPIPNSEVKLFSAEGSAREAWCEKRSMHPPIFKNPDFVRGFFLPMKKFTNIHIGHCTTPHGIKGEFSFVLYNDEDSVLENGVKVTLTPRSPASSVPQDGKDFVVKKISFGNKAIATLEGVNDRNTVEAMIPFDIYMDRQTFPETDDDEYYINDLLGLEVYHYYTKNFIGRVIDFYENGAQIVLKIKTENEIIEVLFMNQYVPMVDIDQNRLEIIPPIMVE